MCISIYTKVHHNLQLHFICLYRNIKIYCVANSLSKSNKYYLKVKLPYTNLDNFLFSKV